MYRYKIKLPASVAYETIPDRESPWGESQWFRDEIMNWLDSRVGNRWDHDVDYGSDQCIVEVEDRDIALLFKLTWGGCGK